jgi:NADPH2:quinone reductase
MKAQIIRKFGDPSVFEFTDVAKPTMQPGHVLIRVCATSVNQIDCKIRSGGVPAIAPKFPAILHGDVAGIVEAVAPDVQRFKIGDEVFGCAGGLKGSGGALAEFMLADARLLVNKP